MKLKEYINEERLHSKDKRAIIGFINTPPKGKTAYKTQSGNLFKVEPFKNGVKFVHDKDDFELVATLVDITDSLGGYDFDTKPGQFIISLKGPK